MYLVCGPMLCMAVRGLSFFCNIYMTYFFFFNLYIYIFHCYLLYIYECIYCRKKISLVLLCKASAHKPSNVNAAKKEKPMIQWAETGLANTKHPTRWSSPLINPLTEKLNDKKTSQSLKPSKK